MAADEAQMPFIRNLASSDRKLRTASLDSLKLFLSTRADLSRIDALKLWKGLYYAHYMTDRPLPQQRLATDLAGLADALPNHDGSSSVPTWFAAFWEILSERWPHIDTHRTDKFLLLVRRVFAAQLRHAAGDVAAVVDVFTQWPFELEGDRRKVPLGLRLHALDIWIDELERESLLGTDGADGADADPLVRRLGDMVQALRYSPIKAVRERARESDDDERLPWVQKKEEITEEGTTKDDDEWGGFDD